MKTTMITLLLLFAITLFSQQTVTIGTQTWMSENLNVGTKIPATQAQANNGIVEKYCYNNDEANCTLFGGLYAWDEMMNYSIAEGSQGICPDGFHVPTNAEIRTLVDYIGDSTNAGRMLKETGWERWLWQPAWDRATAIQKADINAKYQGLNTYGFTAVGGGKSYAGYFVQKKTYGWWWTSTKSAYIYNYSMNNIGWNCYVYPNFPTGAWVPKVSVRCIKN